MTHKSDYNTNMLNMSAIRSIEIQTAHRTKNAREDQPDFNKPESTPDIRYNSYIINLRDLSLKRPPKV